MNCALDQCDKKGGKPVMDSVSSRAFHSLIFEQNCMDLAGSHFTWNNNRGLRDRIQIRIGLLSKFLDCFPDMSIKHLVRTGSDHNPLLLTTDPPKRKSSSMFRFEHFWLSHEDGFGS